MSTSRRAGWRRFWKALEIGNPDLDHRPDRILEPGLPRDRQGLLVALPDLGRIDALFETIVAGYQELSDPRVRILGLHERSVAGHISV